MAVTLGFDLKRKGVSPLASVRVCSFHTGQLALFRYSYRQRARAVPLQAGNALDAHKASPTLASVRMVSLPLANAAGIVAERLLK